MKPSKFKVGDVVTGRTKYKEVVFGTVTEVRKHYQECNANGFVPKGLIIDETTLPSFAVPYRVEGEMLYVEHPEQDFGSWIKKAHTNTYKLKGWSIVFHNKDLQLPYTYIFPEKALKLKSNGTV